MGGWAPTTHPGGWVSTIGDDQEEARRNDRVRRTLFPLWGISLVPLVDGPRYRPDTYVVNGVGLGSSFDGTGSTTVSSTVNYVGTLLGRLTSPLQVRGAWVTIRQDIRRDDSTTSAYRNGVLLGSWPVGTNAMVGDKMFLNSGVPNGSGGSNCWKNLRVYVSP